MSHGIRMNVSLYTCPGANGAEANSHSTTNAALSGFQDPQFVMKQVEELLAAGYDGVHPNTLQVEADEQQAAYEARVKVKKEQDRMAKVSLCVILGAML